MNISPKIKQIKIVSLAFGTLILGLQGSGYSAVTIAHVENSSTGGFRTQSGLSLSAGEISVGFFTSDPTVAQWNSLAAASVATAWDSVLSLGFKDVRSLAGATLATGFDWSFLTGTAPSTNIGGTVQNIPIASLPQNTRLYVLGFNAGTWDNTSKTGTFGQATEWAVVSAFGHATASQNFISPADLGTKSITFKAAALTASDILVGQLLSSTDGTVSMIPEPSTSALMFGSLLLALRRRKNR
jgi:hypothetical protein